MSPAAKAALELWAGVECTVNRVGQSYHDQIDRTGHHVRLRDLDRFAELGLRTLRYPILWERTAPRGLRHADWRWADERMRRLRELGIRPIVGLLHHGSGPAHTSLVDPAFAEELAWYARAVAERYPWALDFTPVNEPLTTARFSGLYGHWYPHGRDRRTFVRAVLTQCRATVLAMRTIRQVSPQARLIQTEDMGTTYSTRMLSYQARHENERRMLGLELLCGRVDRKHPWWGYLCKWGASEAELEFFLSSPTPPDIIGMNYYVTSDRMLDERLEHYPEWSRGGNDRHAYADVEAARVREDGIEGHYTLLGSLWDRYRLPLAITEAHLACTREEQLRWLDEAWRAALQARAAGVDVRAVTAWSLLGAFDWHNLVTCAAGRYEPGIFDIRAATPRPTALAHMVRELASGRQYHHPVLATPGWWRRPERLQLGPRELAFEPCPQQDAPAQPILVTGSTGTLGKAFARICHARGLSCRPMTRAEMDIADPESVRAALEQHRPWAIVNAAGYVRVDEAERDRARCRRENTTGPQVLARLCRAQGARLVTFSSDLVFDGGGRSAPYVESDHVCPLNVYGASKVEAEEQVLAVMPEALIVRTSAFFGPWDNHNFVSLALRELSRGRPFRAALDSIVSPTYVPDLVHATLDLLIDGQSGVWHLANRGAVSWAEFAVLGAELTGMACGLVEPCPSAALGLAAPRPPYSVLGSERAALMPPLEEALERYVRERSPAP